MGISNDFDDETPTVKIPHEELLALRLRSAQVHGPALPPKTPMERDLPCADCSGVGWAPLSGRCEWCEGTGRVCQ
jgi:hypothetical protein